MRKPAIALVAAALAASACVSQDDPSLTVQALSTDVAFGVEIDEPAAGPVLPPAEAPIPEQAQQGGFEPPQLTGGDLGGFDTGNSSRLPPLPPSTPQVECPKAPPTAGADEVASENATSMPEEGVYRWKREGTQTIVIPETGTTVEVEISGFEKRIIQNVTEVSDTSFSFEMVAPLLDRPAVSITTYLVETDSTQFQPGGAVVIDEPRVNEPEGGVTIQRIVIQEDDGSESSFNPTTGLLLIGLPVVSGEEFRSSSVDPRSGQSTVSDAKVLNRDRIDACGELADGWRVESTQNRSDSAGPVTYNYLIAPQFGGTLIKEEIQRTDAEGNTLDITFTLAQLDPDPLPEDEA